MLYNYFININESMLFVTKEPVAFDRLFMQLGVKFAKHSKEGSYLEFIESLKLSQDYAIVATLSPSDSNKTYKIPANAKRIKLLFKSRIFIFDDNQFSATINLEKHYFSFIVYGKDHFTSRIIDGCRNMKIIMPIIRELFASLCVPDNSSITQANNVGIEEKIKKAKIKDDFKYNNVEDISDMKQPNIVIHDNNKEEKEDTDGKETDFIKKDNGIFDIPSEEAFHYAFNSINEDKDLEILIQSGEHE